VTPVVAGLQDGEPIIYGYDTIGCGSTDNFVFGGTGGDGFMGCGETWYRKGLSPQKLEDMCINALTSVTDRDIQSGWNGACYVLTKDEIVVKQVKLKQV